MRREGKVCGSGEDCRDVQFPTGSDTLKPLSICVEEHGPDSNPDIRKKICVIRKRKIPLLTEKQVKKIRPFRRRRSWSATAAPLSDTMVNRTYFWLTK